jgi:hypothetical protein
MIVDIPAAAPGRISSPTSPAGTGRVGRARYRVPKYPPMRGKATHEDVTSPQIKPAGY